MFTSIELLCTTCSHSSRLRSLSHICQSQELDIPRTLPLMCPLSKLCLIKKDSLGASSSSHSTLRCQPCFEGVHIMAHGIPHATALVVTVGPPSLLCLHVGPLKVLHLLYQSLLLSTVVIVPARLLCGHLSFELGPPPG